MDNQSGEDCAKSASATYSPAEEIVGQDEDVAENAIISEKVGTRKDQLDMLRMGKTPQLKVC
jgi:hypothetical protein